MHIKNPLILDKIQASMNLLYDLIEEIDKYQDKSLFFQDPRVIEGWLLLAGDIKEIEIEDAPESDEKWELRSEPFAATLLARRDLFSNYKKLYHLYYDPLYNLWMNYSGMDWDCVSADAKEALKANQYLQGQKDVEDLNEYIEQLNSRSNDARYALYKTLTGIFDILQAIMNKAGQVVIDLKPSDEDFAKAINDDLRGMTHSYGKSLFGDMKEDLTRHYKEHRTDRYTPELWSEMLDADEKALCLAKRKQLADCDTTKQEHWGEDMKKQMDENSELMQLIYSSCRTDELFDLRMVDDIQRFISLLNSNNLSIFYDIIVRRNLIQCEMFSELKKQHEEWLNNSSENVTNEEDVQTSDEPQMPNGDTAEDALKDCFKVCSEFVRGQIDKVIKESYNSTAANLALIEIVLFDHNLLRKRNSHKAFVNALVAWNLINVSDEKELNKIARAVADKFKRMPEEGYKSWNKDYVNDKSFCENIGKKLGDTIKYNR